jgi:eukaryotic-like serine/threonine-protein kinase
VTDSPTAAHELLGLTLPGGWKVTKKLAKPPGATGGNFSVGYIVQRNGGEAFLKAIDYSRALRAQDVPRALQALTEAFNFERDLLEKCRRERLSRIVHAIDEGQVDVTTAGTVPTVNYLIFDMADGDVRRFRDAGGRFDDAWALRALHHVASGLEQLHRKQLAHQDVKPSNVLVFATESKLADLGRGSYVGHPSPHDTLIVQGDPTYAPPELLYGRRGSDWQEQSQACDMYLLGSFAAFLFTAAGMTPSILARLADGHKPRQWGGSYEGVLPYVRDAFDKAIETLERSLHPEIAAVLAQVVRELCDPDPRFRGHPRNRAGRGSPYSLERYVSVFNRLARRAEMGLIKFLRA